MSNLLTRSIPKILAVSGSLRAASSNTAALKAINILAAERARITIYEGLANLPHFNPDIDTENIPSASVTDWRDKLKETGGVLISSPEYAHGVPGTFKNALDWVVGSGELVGKPVALINASPRSTYAQAALKETLSVMTASIITEASVTVPLAGRKLDEHGIVKDSEISAILRQAIKTFIEAIERVSISNESKT